MMSTDSFAAAHMRRYDPDGVLGPVDEVFQIGRDAGVAVHISHFNSRADLVLPKVDGGRAWFAASPAPLDSVRLSYVAADKYRSYEGLSLAEAARAADAAEVGTFICDVLVASELAVGCIVPHRNRGNADIAALMQHPAMMGGSDGIFTGTCPHPRGCGCYARYLGPHVRTEHTWSLETAVQRLAAHPARRFGLVDRGLLLPGLAADVIVFDAATIADRSTFENGRALAAGMDHVVVNGEVVLQGASGRRGCLGEG